MTSDRAQIDAWIDAWKQEILDLRTGQEWAFFTGRIPAALADVERRLAELHALIEEHSA